MVYDIIPPTTGKKKKALRVFGEAVADDFGGSLNYSQSTSKSSSCSPSREGSLSSTALATLAGCNLPDLDSSKHQSNSVLDEVVVTNKENHETHDDNASRGNGIATLAEHNGTTQPQCISGSMRMPTRSPLRRDLVKLTQEAINKASASVANSLNPSVAAARKAAFDSHKAKSKLAMKSHSGWEKDTIEAKTFSEQMEQNRREILSLQRELSSKFSKAKARLKSDQRDAFLKGVEKESQFNSAVFREHQEKQKQEKDERRRGSVTARTKLRLNHRMGDERLKLIRIAEDRALFEERYATSIAIQSTARQTATQRRKSFAFRNGDARRIRALHASMETERQSREHASFLLNQLAENDAAEYQRQLANERRESLVMRNIDGHKHREMESRLRSKSLVEEHQSYELKWAGEDDARAYKQRMSEERRQSLAKRNEEGKRQRDLTEQLRSDERHQEHESLELKWAAEKDAAQFLSSLEHDRRKSLAFRNMEGKRHRDLENVQHSDEIRLRHESLELKWAGERDAQAYQRQMEAERRESLSKRNKEAREARERSQVDLSAAIAREHESFELKRAADKDVEQYIKDEQAARRESLARRNKERVQHAKVMDELQQLAREKEAESFVLKWAGENDVHAYEAQLAEERRKSLQLRGKESRNHREVEATQHVEALNRIHKDEEMKATDQMEVARYLKDCAERNRKSLEYRRIESRVQRLQEKDRHVKEVESEEQNQQFETLARTDVVQYVKDCKQRRRMSLAHRANEKRKHGRWQREQKEKELTKQSRLVHDRLMDRRHIELAKQQERARVALDAIRHAGYGSYNPLSKLLS